MTEHQIVDQRYLEFITRQNCLLCEEGMGVVLKATFPFGIAVHTIDVDADADLHAEFSSRVPVVRSPTGKIIDEGRISLWRVRAALTGMTVYPRRGRM